MNLPGTYERCMSGHYFACTRGDEECPTCEQLKTLKARIAQLEQDWGTDVELAGQALDTAGHRQRFVEREKEALLEALARVRGIACGEIQLEDKDAVDDTEALAYIYRYLTTILEAQ